MKSESALTAYMRSIGRYPLLSRAEFLELFAVVQECWIPFSHRNDLTPEEQEIKAKGLKARNRIIECNMRLVVSIAQRFRRSNVPLEDLISEGVEGLKKAIDKFDPSKGCTFSTHAHWWVLSVLNNEVCNKSRLVRLPRHQYEDRNKIRRLSHELTLQYGKQPTLTQLAEAAGKPPEWVQKVVWAHRPIASLDYKHDLDGAGLIDLIADDRNPSSLTETQEYLEGLLKYLTPTQREIVELRSGIKTGKKMKLREVGSRFGKTAEWARRQYNEAFRKLQQINEWKTQGRLSA